MEVLSIFITHHESFLWSTFTLTCRQRLRRDKDAIIRIGVTRCYRYIYTDSYKNTFQGNGPPNIVLRRKVTMYV